MELRQLRYFATVARMGTYAAAAERLHIAQPALWQQVRSLEKELGTPLFERVGRRVRLSRHGSALLERVEQVLGGADLVLRLSRSVAAGRSGLVVVACAPPHVPRFLAAVVARFRRDHPDVGVELREHPPISGWPLDELLPGTADLAVAAPVKGYLGFPVYTARVSVPVPRGHRWYGRAQVAVEELDGEPLLAASHPNLSRTLLDQACALAGFEPTIALESPSPSTLLALGRAGVGVPVFADDAAAMVGDPAAPVLSGRDGPLTAPVWLQWRPEVAMTPALEAFIGTARSLANATSPRAPRAAATRRAQPARDRSNTRPGRGPQAPRSSAARPRGRR